MDREKVLMIAERRNAGVTNKIIATELGISPSTVAYWVKRLKAEGIEMKIIKGRRPITLK